MASLDELVSQFHDRLKAVKDRTRLDGGEWYPWRSLAAMQMLDQRMGVGADELRRMIGKQPSLDVGCGDGDVAFFLESLGAEVDAVDHPLTNYNRMEGVRALKQALGSRIGIHAVDLDARPNLPRSNYGFAMMLGVLYHLKNPFLALETLAHHAQYLYISTRIAALTPDGRQRFSSYPMAYLVDDRELNNDSTNFWIFSQTGLERLVRRAGWNVLKQFTLGASAEEADPVATDARAFLLLESRLAKATGLALGLGWHELDYGSSRWTGKRFSARVDVVEPLTPATLRFVFHLPDALVAQRPRTALRASVNGTPLASIEFTSPGEHEYSATLPLVPAGQAEVDFELDSAARIGSDERELGVQVYFTGPAPIRIE